MPVIMDKKILLLDKNGLEICRFLENDGLKDVTVAETINGESILSFSIPKTNEKFQYLFLIDTTLEIDNGKRYSLMKEGAIQSSRGLAGTVYADVNAAETWYLLGNDYVTAENSNKESGLVGFSSLLILSKSKDPLRVNGRIVTPSYPVGSVGYALQAILWDSGWNVGTVDDTGQKYDVLTDKKTILENVMEVQRLWGGMLFWDSHNKTVDLRSESAYQPYEQFQIRYGINLQEITRQQNNAIVTRLYPRGNNNLHIGGVNGGVKYIEDYRYSNIRYVRQIQNPDIYTPELLLSWGKEQLEKLCRPQYQYTVKTLDLSKLLNEKNQDIKLGYMVDMIDTDIVATADGKECLRVVSHSYDYFHPVRCEVGIGDKIGQFVELFRDMTAYSGIIKDTVSGDGTIGGDLVNIEDNQEYAGLKDRYMKFEVETDTEFSNAYASIELLSDETQAKITLLTEYTDKKFIETNTSITQLSNYTQSSITSLTSYVNTQLSTTTSTLRQEISTAKSAAILQATSYTDNYATSKTEFTQYSSATSADIKLVVSYAGTGIRRLNTAGIVLSVNNSDSNVMISAKKITLEGATTFISNIVGGINSGRTEIDGGKLKANSITASKIAAHTITANEISSNYIYAGTIKGDKIDGGTIKGVTLQWGESQYNSLTSDGYTGTWKSGRSISIEAKENLALSSGYCSISTDRYNIAINAEKQLNLRGKYSLSLQDNGNSLNLGGPSSTVKIQGKTIHTTKVLNFLDGNKRQVTFKVLFYE